MPHGFPFGFRILARVPPRVKQKIAACRVDAKKVGKGIDVEDEKERKQKATRRAFDGGLVRDTAKQLSEGANSALEAMERQERSRARLYEMWSGMVEKKRARASCQAGMGGRPTARSLSLERADQWGRGAGRGNASVVQGSTGVSR